VQALDKSWRGTREKREYGGKYKKNIIKGIGKNMHRMSNLRKTSTKVMRYVFPYLAYDKFHN
jgi:hypothetical protein